MGDMMYTPMYTYVYDYRYQCPPAYSEVCMSSLHNVCWCVHYTAYTMWRLLLWLFLVQQDMLCFVHGGTLISFCCWVFLYYCNTWYLYMAVRCFVAAPIPCPFYGRPMERLTTHPVCTSIIQSSPALKGIGRHLLHHTHIQPCRHCQWSPRRDICALGE